MASSIWKWLFFAARNKIPKDQAITITENGTTNAPSGTRYTPITVNVPIPAEKKIQATKSVTVSANGSSEIAPDTGYDGIGKVNLTTSVPVPNVQPTQTALIKRNGTTTIVPDGFFQAMKSAEVTVDVPTQTDKHAEYTENGTYTVKPDTNYLVMEKAQVVVNVPEKQIQASKAVTITENGTTNVTPDTGYDGLAKVAVTTNVPVPAVQASKAVTLTENGTTSVTPDSGFDALQKVDVTVNVAGSTPVTVTIQNNNPYEDFQVYLAGKTPTLLLTVSTGTSATHTFEQYTPYFFCYRTAGTNNPDPLPADEIITNWEISKNVFLCNYDADGDTGLIRSSASWADFYLQTNGTRNFVTAMFCDANATETIVIPNPAG